MANNSNQKTPAKQISVSSLLSPPEMKRSESFGSSATPSIATTSFSSFATMGPQPQYAKFSQTPQLQHNSAATYALASPPISPYESNVQQGNMDPEDRMDEDVLDPQLFRPSEAGSSVAADEPLFPQEQAHPTSPDPITRHMESAEYAQLRSQPTREDYELAVTVVSNVYDLYNKNPRAWFLQERKFDREISQKRDGTHKREPLKKLAPAPTSRSQARLPKVGIPRLARSPRAPRVQKRTPRAQVYDSFSEAGPSSASPKPARPAGTRDDTDFNSLPDYSPPLGTLGTGNSNALKTEWKGSALKLTDDPDRHLLHEAEIPLAGTLRLSCATYLCSKRRIFQARIEALRIGKEFRKTDAQQACKIDVNKASKLWSVYDKVGWFDPKYFINYV
ncbi:hypothetical protein BU23DRAFT_549224 [Bimuria novae-zelandiae CBS 107.79]|uniref:SWIRM domain-containing protein n=1 Tax=Bimuria novae-zelandiae CBS 107.79 TaxID=1447943 RepID=A0A6A5VQE8_9PLEO|nr:hypothetical protein BU23DRAFT_549224 [Bimuria novae-zelandiae CBS 107.79]